MSSPNFVADTKIIFGYNFVAPLIAEAKYPISFAESGKRFVLS